MSVFIPLKFKAKLVLMTKYTVYKDDNITIMDTHTPYPILNLNPTSTAAISYDGADIIAVQGNLQQKKKLLFSFGSTLCYLQF